MIRVTIACPEAMIGDANQLALCLGYGPQDAQTYGAALWQDQQGNCYALSSSVLSEADAARLQAPLSAPDWGCDLVAAARAQSALQVGVTAAPDVIAARIGGGAAQAIAALGVQPALPPEGDPP